MINNSFTLSGVVVGTYAEKFDCNLGLFEIEIDKKNLESVTIPVMYGEFTKGNFKKGDKIVVEGNIDIINSKVCCVASSIINLVEWK